MVGVFKSDEVAEQKGWSAEMRRADEAERDRRTSVISEGVGWGFGTGHGKRYCVFSSRRRHTRLQGDWSSDVCSSDLGCGAGGRTVARSASVSSGLTNSRTCPKTMSSAGSAWRISNWRSSFPGTKRSSASRKDRKSTRLNSSHLVISYAVFCLKKKETS